MCLSRINILTVRIDGRQVRELVVLPPDVRRSDVAPPDPRAVSGNAPIAGALRGLEIGAVASYDAAGVRHRVELLSVVVGG